MTTDLYNYRPQRSCGQGYVFTRVCDSVHGGGGVLRALPPPPGPGRPPPAPAAPGRHPLAGNTTPPSQADTPSPGPGNPPCHTRLTPPGREPPRHQVNPPPPGRRLQHTVNERPVRILLECILVL